MTTPSRWPHFSKEELSCRCGCQSAAMSDPFMTRLISLRDLCGFPLPVSSGYRCPAHNAAVSDTGHDGPHTHGIAVDIGVSRADATTLIRCALSMGFRGIGIKQHGPDAGRFVHVDDDLRPVQILWTY